MATRQNTVHSWYYQNYYPYYGNGWQDGESGNTPISASALNQDMNWMKSVNNYGNYLDADLASVYYIGEDDDPDDFIKIADFSDSWGANQIYIPNFQKQIDALEARIAALEGNT